MHCVLLQAIQDKLLKGLKISAEERALIGRRRVYQSELEALDSSMASDMTLEEEVMERQRRHEAKLAKQGIKVCAQICLRPSD